MEIKKRVAPRCSSQNSIKIEKKDILSQSLSTTACYYATKMDPYLQVFKGRVDVFAKRIRELAESGKSGYAVDGETSFDLPANIMRGRAGNQGKTFSGRLNMETGSLRVDCAEEPSFWLEIDLFDAPYFKFSPDGEGYQNAKRRWDEAIATDAEDPDVETEKVNSADVNKVNSA